jgi:hypothetical protein
MLKYIIVLFLVIMFFFILQNANNYDNYTKKYNENNEIQILKKKFKKLKETFELTIGGGQGQDTTSTCLKNANVIVVLDYIIQSLNTLKTTINTKFTNPDDSKFDTNPYKNSIDELEDSITLLIQNCETTKELDLCNTKCGQNQDYVVENVPDFSHHCECTTGYVQNSSAETCVACPTNSSGKVCSGFGRCSYNSDNKSAVCDCDTVYTGTSCDTCTPGYVQKSTGETCVACPTNSSGKVCSGFGRCSYNNDNKSAVCDCDTVYTGTSCDTCTPGYVQKSTGETCVACPTNSSGKVCSLQMC